MSKTKPALSPAARLAIRACRLMEPGARRIIKQEAEHAARGGLPGPALQLRQAQAVIAAVDAANAEGAESEAAPAQEVINV